MLELLRRRLTYANVVATLALVFAMTGGALAAGHYLVNSTKQINPKVLKALKGANGKAGATGATGATGAGGAPGAPGLKGEHGTTGEAGQQGIEGPIGATSAPAAHWNETVNKTEPVQLDKVGPFTITGKCTLEEGDASAQTFISSSEEGSWVDVSETTAGGTKLTAGQQFPIDEEVEGKAGAGSFLTTEGGPFSALSADGKHSLSGVVSDGAFATAEACTFVGYAIGE